LACYEQSQLPDCTLLIDTIYTSIVIVFTNGANQLFPHCPESRPIFDKRQSCRLIYRKRNRESQNHSLSSYSNDLYKALLHTNGPAFWKVWRSKFNNNDKPIEVDGCSDTKMIVNELAHYFADSSSANSVTRASELDL